jgi:hypothetical protein
VKKPVHHNAVRRPVVTAEENEADLRKKAVADARAQLLRPESADALQPAPTTPEVVDATAIPANGAAALVPPAPVVAEPRVDQLSPDQAAPVDVESLLAKVPFASDTVVSSAPAAPPGELSSPNESADEWEWLASEIGVVLMTLGLVFLVGPLLAGQFLDPGVGASRRISSVRTEADQTA